MSSPIKPQHFCTRPDGVSTPLIAVDELPTQISIRGVPRTLQPDQTRGMTSLGTVAPRRSRTYVVDCSGYAPRSSRPPQDSDQQAMVVRLLRDESLPDSLRLAMATLHQHGLLHGLLDTDSSWVGSSGGAGGNGAGGNGANGGNGGNGGSKQGPQINPKKIFCSYWIRHGECDYIQQGKSTGCIYRHIMPLDLQTLDMLGLRDIPRWYREKYNIPSLLLNGHHQRSLPDVANLSPMDSAAFPELQYPTRPQIEGVPDIPEIQTEIKQDAAGPSLPMPQSSLALPGPSRPAYESRKAPGSQKHGAKHPSGSKRLDLMSPFDNTVSGFPNYSTVGSTSGNMYALGYPRSQEAAAFAANPSGQGNEFFRNIQSLMPGTMAGNSASPMAGPALSGLPPQGRSRRAQRSRRLYEARSNAASPKLGNTDAFGSFNRNQGPALSTVPAPVPMASLASRLTSPIIGPLVGNTSEPPTRECSPRIEPGSLSTKSSPDFLRTQVNPRGRRPSFGAIGAMRGRRQQSSNGSSPKDNSFMSDSKFRD
ncbi:hypothetical protein BO94DRAFT_620699 [Aspergillus sclerotioniger CBS 115572]|uniref:C3H1-type domain-containing protein n=1 Tax=Aspergillus sclerotioniger CBS 115572 TaxID=1450535 RepID=A0A317XA18_9EURO|nr:hypothetical protein BO94DRAFT_620699 [Aspergillus sclerotioniger CBS 115572]PWY95225.1 hypothetical protein BO94DRAFT_620699 [Aspergillus sclerotioniger CBS 115572]